MALKLRFLRPCAVALISVSALAQSNSHPSATPDDQPHTVKRDIKDTLGGLFVDQKLIWTSPFRLQPKDMAWLVPDTGIAAGLFATDRTTSRELSRRGLKRAGTFSNAGLAAFAGVAGGMYLLGVDRNDDHMRETGRLSAEAAADAF